MEVEGGHVTYAAWKEVSARDGLGVYELGQLTRLDPSSRARVGSKDSKINIDRGRILCIRVHHQTSQ